jgi:hypothetical protein
MLNGDYIERLRNYEQNLQIVRDRAGRGGGAAPAFYLSGGAVPGCLSASQASRMRMQDLVSSVSLPTACCATRSE